MIICYYSVFASWLLLLYRKLEEKVKNRTESIRYVHIVKPFLCISHLIPTSFPAF